jgi:hypothetical protein
MHICEKFIYCFCIFGIRYVVNFLYCCRDSLNGIFPPLLFLAFTKHNIKSKVYEPTYRMGPGVSVVILVLKKDSISY